MEQIPSNTPVMESKPGIAGWFTVWRKALTQPNEQTFIDITEDPNASARTAYIWVFIAGTVSGIAQAILQGVYSILGVTPTIPGLEEYMPSTTTTGGDPAAVAITLVVSICAAPLIGGLSVLFFAIFAALMQWIGKLFGGVGTYDKILYALAAISAPFTLIAAVLTLLNAIPFIGACFGILSFGLSIYALVLQIMAVKGVHRFGWGPAVGTVLLPGLAIFVVCCCVVFGTVTLLGPVLGDTFNQINQGLAP